MRSNQEISQAIDEIRGQKEKLSFKPESVCNSIPSLLKKEYRYYILHLVLNSLLEYKINDRDMKCKYIVPVIYSDPNEGVSKIINSLYKKDPNVISFTASAISKVFNMSKDHQYFVKYLTSIFFPNLYLHFITSSKCKIAAAVIIELYNMNEKALFQKLASSFFFSYLPFVQSFYSHFEWKIFHTKTNEEYDSATIKELMMNSFISAFQSSSKHHRRVLDFITKCDEKLHKVFIKEVLENLVSSFISSRKLIYLRHHMRLIDLCAALVEDTKSILQNAINSPITCSPDIESDILDSGVCFVTRLDAFILQAISVSENNGKSQLSEKGFFDRENICDDIFTIFETNYELPRASGTAADAAVKKTNNSRMLDQWEGLQLTAKEEGVDPFSFLTFDEGSKDFINFVIGYEKERIDKYDEENNILRNKMYSVTCLRNSTKFLRRVVNDTFAQYSLQVNIEVKALNSNVTFPLNEKLVKEINNDRHNKMLQLFTAYLTEPKIFDKKEVDRIKKGGVKEPLMYLKDFENGKKLYNEIAVNKPNQDEKRRIFLAGFDEKLQTVLKWYHKFSRYQSLQIFKKIDNPVSEYLRRLPAMPNRGDRLSEDKKDSDVELLYEPSNILFFQEFTYHSLDQGKHVDILHGFVEFVESLKSSFDQEDVKHYPNLLIRMIKELNLSPNLIEVLAKILDYYMLNVENPRFDVFQSLDFPKAIIENLKELQMIFKND